MKTGSPIEPEQLMTRSPCPFPRQSRRPSPWPRRAVATLLLCSSSLVSATTVDFGGGLPPGATISSTIGSSGPGLGITDFSSFSGNYLDGYVDVPFLSADLPLLSGRELSLSVTRVNAMEDGDFEAGTLGTAASPWTEFSGLVSSGASATLRGSAARLTVPAGGTSAPYFQQYFPTKPGDVYRLSYSLYVADLLPAYTGTWPWASLEVRARYGSTASDTGVIRPASPTAGYSGSTANSSSPDRYELIASHTSASSTQRVIQHFAVADCDENVTFDDGTTHLGFVRYASADCASAIQYAAITFTAQAQAPSAETTVRIASPMFFA